MPGQLKKEPFQAIRDSVKPRRPTSTWTARDPRRSDSLSPVYCPRCGAENQPGNRYCIECGSALSQAAAPSSRLPVRARLKQLLGTTKRARLLSAGTILAAVLAVAAFVALKPGSGSTPDPFIRSLDKACLEEKGRIAALERGTRPRSPAGVAIFATSLVSLVEEWRLSLARSPTPASHVQDARLLDSRLREVLIEAGALARVARDGKPQQVVSQAQSVDNATKRADQTMEDLELSSCSAFKIGAADRGSP